MAAAHIIQLLFTELPFIIQSH